MVKHKFKCRNFDVKSFELAYNCVKLQNLNALNYRVPVTTPKDREASRVSLTTYASGIEYIPVQIKHIAQGALENVHWDGLG